MGEEEGKEEESKFFAINSLREIIREEKELKKRKNNATEFINELQLEREMLGWNHMTVRFKGGEKLSVDDHTGCIVLVAPNTMEGRKNISVEEDFAILDRFSSVEVVKFEEIMLD